MTFYLFLLINLPHHHSSQIIKVPIKSRYWDQVHAFSKITYFPHLIALIVRFNRTKAGEYQVPGMSSFLSVLQSIRGHRVLYRVFIPEGSSSAETVFILNNYKFLTGKIDKIPMDGTIMASTYLATLDTQRSLILNSMRNFATKKQDALWANRPENYPFSRDEWIIIGSILEKEGLDFIDKQKICGVIINRLKKKMRLQIDATILFIKTKGLYAQRITWDDLTNQNHRSSYNTYINYGLPPGPITNPGVESLKAALTPISHNFLYYRLVKGSHIFNETFEGHKLCAKEIIQTKSLPMTS